MPLSFDQMFKDLSDEEREVLFAEAKRIQEAQETLKVTDSEQWKSPRKEGFLVELPSGNVCRMRRSMVLLTMLKTGKIPNPLGNLVQQMVDRGELALNLQAMDTEAKIQALDLVDQIVVSAMVEPRVIIPPEGVNPEIYQAPPGAITMMDLDITDKLFIATVAQGGTTDVTQFRTEQTRVVESIRHGASGDVSSEPVARPKRAKRSSSARKR